VTSLADQLPMATRTKVELVQVKVERRDAPDELAGHWCQCPRTGQEVRLERCLGCEHAAQFHVEGPEGTSHLLCAVESLAEDAPPRPGEAHAAPVSAIMTARPVCVGASMRIEKLLPLLVDQNIGGVPVVDAQGRPVGMVSKTDLLANEADRADAEEVEREFPPVGELLGAFADGNGAQHTAGDLMSTPLLCVRETDSVARAAHVMSTRSVHRLGVIDAEGRLVGVVSTTDVVRWLATR
jgi:CBS domain-containing protein